MKALWQKLAKRYDGLQLRERKLVAVAVVVGLGMFAYTLVIEPAQRQNKLLESGIAQKQSDLATAQAQTVALRGQIRDPNAPNRTALNAVKVQTGTVENDLHRYDGILVSPSAMPRMLQALLAKHRGLELVNLKTLPVTPLLDSNKDKGDTPAPANIALPAINKATGQPNPPPGGMYRHGVEITIAGSYADLLSYAEELQRLSPRPLWSAMELKVIEYPRSQVTFTLYTLSLDLPWLAV
ncbi:MAG TPA: type II secretion system protein GspM [Rhodocyclaceae bacterium]|nr:type II secretion system protein GspM [Rhodocyclaceae bacterium]